MTDEKMCYAMGCCNPGSFKCGACNWVRYCSAMCQKKDWKQGHKHNCKRYQSITKAKQAGELQNPQGQGIIALFEMREGCIPLAWTLEHPATTTVVTHGIIDLYKIVHKRTGRRLTHEMNESELSHNQRRDIVLAYLYSWLSDLVMNNPTQVSLTLAKSEPVCHMCRKAGDLDDTLEDGGLMPDRRWAYCKMLCQDCFMRTRPQKAPDTKSMKWQIVAYDPAPTPASWRS